MTPPNKPSNSSIQSGAHHGRHLSARRRKLRWTAAGLSAAAVLGVAVTAKLYLDHRPAPYHPDEINRDITSQLTLSLPSKAPEPRFQDVTAQAGLDTVPLFQGERTSQLPEDMGAGAAWGDYDNDGDDDLFIVAAGGSMNLPPEEWAPSRLYENLGNGGFKPVPEFPETRILGMGAAWGDANQDGYLDLVVTGYNVLRLYVNQNGTGKFIQEPGFPEPQGYWAGAAWGDFDRDRDLDLYVCGYVRYQPAGSGPLKATPQFGTAVPYTLNPASFPSERNLLLRNQDDGHFEECAESLGIDNPQGRSLGALWHDFDQDGWLDLYVANDISDNAFYHNTNGRFEDWSHPACIADYRGAMGLAVGDWNRDGDDDLFITHWIAQENALYDNLLNDLAGMSRAPNASAAAPVSNPNSNSASANTPNLAATFRFMDASPMVGLGQVALQQVGWGTEFVDLDADGWLDLVVANGSTLESKTKPKTLQPQKPFLFWNHGGQHFYDLAPLHPDLARPYVSRGLAVSDYDRDGAMDILLVHRNEGVQLLRNQMQSGHWLKIRLRSLNAKGQLTGRGEGSSMIAHVGDIILRRTVPGVSYLSQNSRTAHFGLNTAKQIDRLEVRWLGGPSVVYGPLHANSTWELREGDPIPHRIPSHQPETSPQFSDRKSRLREFWTRHRAAMQALKADHDYPRAARLFRAALALNPEHEDARYYLSHCLAQQGDITAALDQLQQLMELNPRSHRACQQWGRLRALTAANRDQLDAARSVLLKAHDLNPEETGVLRVLAEVTLLLGNRDEAAAHFQAVTQSNTKAVGAFFLRGYLAWKNDQPAQAERMLENARSALGEDWQPAGGTAEGDVQQQWHTDATPLESFWKNWDGQLDPKTAYAALDRHLQQLNNGAASSVDRPLQTSAQ